MTQNGLVFNTALVIDNLKKYKTTKYFLNDSDNNAFTD